MNNLQKYIKLLTPKALFSRIEAESKTWFLSCECGWKISIWDAGGLRYKATKSKKKQLGKCPVCNEMRWFSYSKE